MLILDVACRNIPLYGSFYKSLWFDCSIRVFQSFAVICKCQTFAFNKTAKIDNIVSWKFRQ